MGLHIRGSLETKGTLGHSMKVTWVVRSVEGESLFLVEKTTDKGGQDEKMKGTMLSSYEGDVVPYTSHGTIDGG